jgi:hypothetical protein
VTGRRRWGSVSPWRLVNLGASGSVGTDQRSASSCLDGDDGHRVAAAARTVDIDEEQTVALGQQA